MPPSLPIILLDPHSFQVFSLNPNFQGRIFVITQHFPICSMVQPASSNIFGRENPHLPRSDQATHPPKPRREERRAEPALPSAATSHRSYGPRWAKGK